MQQLFPYCRCCHRWLVQMINKPSCFFFSPSFYVLGVASGEEIPISVLHLLCLPSTRPCCSCGAGRIGSTWRWSRALSPECAGLQPQLGGTCPAGRVKIRRSVSNGMRSAGLELGVTVCSSFGLSSGSLGQKFLRSPISLSCSIALFCCCWCLVGLLVVELLDGAGEAAVQGGEFHLSSFLLQLFCCLPSCSAYSHCVLLFSNFLLGNLQY